MCSRFQLKTPIDDIASFFALEDFPDWEPRMEIHPTDSAPVIMAPGTAVLLSFGLPASWEPRKPILNARSETLSEKQMFRPLLNRRCLIPASGYFEWRATETGKRKNLITPVGTPLFTFAGLTDGVHFAIVTCAPLPEIAHIHNRMPVILTKQGAALWLDSAQDFTEVKSLLHPNGRLSVEEEKPPPPAQGDLFG